MRGIILKALSGFYYVDDGAQIVTCRGRGKHRHAKVSPLVGDFVEFTPLGDGTGALDEILPRKNEFQRPAVANIEQIVMVVSQAIPKTDPFLIDRLITIAEGKGCESVICINKCDLESGQELAEIYQSCGYPTVQVSAHTGHGLEELRALIAVKVCAFTGNSGVGKSTLLNTLAPELKRETGQISQKLGRAARRQNMVTRSHEPLGKVHDARFVGNTDQCLFAHSFSFNFKVLRPEIRA